MNDVETHKEANLESDPATVAAMAVVAGADVPAGNGKTAGNAEYGL